MCWAMPLMSSGNKCKWKSNVEVTFYCNFFVKSNLNWYFTSKIMHLILNRSKFWNEIDIIEISPLRCEKTKSEISFILKVSRYFFDPKHITAKECSYREGLAKNRKNPRNFRNSFIFTFKYKFKFMLKDILEKLKSCNTEIGGIA